MASCFRIPLLLTVAVLLAGPVTAQVKKAATPAPRKGKPTVRKPKRDPAAPPLFALPAPITPAQPPLTTPLHLTQLLTTAGDGSAAGTPDTIRATLSYAAPQKTEVTATTWKLRDPDNRDYGVFLPDQQAHFRLEETTTSGTVTKYFIINGVKPARTGAPASYHTTCAVQYPAGHPGGPDNPRPDYLELEYHPECDVQIDWQTKPPTVTIRQPRTAAVQRYQ